MYNYLKSTADKLKTSDYARLTIIMGNESCDLDSAVSAIVYATFLNWTNDQNKCKVCTKANCNKPGYKADIYVPLLDIDREDYELKGEVVQCLNDHGISKSSLIFRDDFDIKEHLTFRTIVVLVDHHVVPKRNEFLKPYILEVIDHRPMERKGWRFREDTRCIIEEVGSCATLVGQRIRDLCAGVRNAVEFFAAFPVCTSLLYSTILLDTLNFSEEVGKGTPHDEDIVSFLELMLELDDFESLRQSKVDALVAARSDVSGLNAPQLLRKDVKITGDILVPSFPILVTEFLKRTDALQAVSEALTARSCSVALLLGMTLSPNLQRDAAVYAPGAQEKAEKLTKHLQDCTDPAFQLVPEDSADGSGCVYFKQTNLTVTRKQYMPVLADFLSNCDK